MSHYDDLYVEEYKADQEKKLKTLKRQIRRSAIKNFFLCFVNFFGGEI